jgi:hypothetical protein
MTRTYWKNGQEYCDNCGHLEVEHINGKCRLCGCEYIRGIKEGMNDE